MPPSLLLPSRRKFLLGAGATLVAPALVRFEALMPVKALPRSAMSIEEIVRLSVKLWTESNKYLQQMDFSAGRVQHGFVGIDWEN